MHITEGTAESDFNRMMGDKQLMADAPLILQALIDERAEVKRLREQNKMLWKYVDTEHMYNDGLLTVEGELIE